MYNINSWQTKGYIFLVSVFSVGDTNSWEALARLRLMVLTSAKEGERTPVVVVGNMVDLDTRDVTRAEAEARVTFEWNWRYKECSAKLGEGVSQVGHFSLFIFSSLYFLGFPRAT